VQLRADLFVAPAFEITKPYDFPFSGGQLVQELLHFFEPFDAHFGRGEIFHLNFGGLAVCLGLDFARRSPASQLVDAAPPSDDGQIGRQAALAAELSQGRIIVGDDLQKDLGGYIFHVFGTKQHAPQVRGVVYDVINQAQKPIHEIVPGAGVTVEAPM